MQLMRIQKINMSLTEKNLREKNFHNELQSEDLNLPLLVRG